jgi:Tfp pilus assembly protein PilF
MSGKTRKQQIEEMLAEEPNDSFLRYGLAMEYVSDKDDDNAVRCFQELLNLDRTYVPAYLQISQALIRLGRWEEARGTLNRGIAAAKQKGDVHAAEEMHGFLAGLG